jgi:hypothetical protein
MIASAHNIGSARVVAAKTENIMRFSQAEDHGRVGGEQHLCTIDRLQ